jgi:hypothetical protein
VEIDLAIGTMAPHPLQLGGRVSLSHRYKTPIPLPMVANCTIADISESTSFRPAKAAATLRR